jgi:hypothetical protein
MMRHLWPPFAAPLALLEINDTPSEGLDRIGERKLQAATGEPVKMARWASIQARKASRSCMADSSS